MEHRDFLVELGTEELPPKALKGLAQAFENNLIQGLRDAGALCADELFDATVFATPRRLAVRVPALAVTTASETVESWGPPVKAAFDANGKPTKAAEGFARRVGVEVSELGRAEQKGAEKLYYCSEKPGVELTSLLPGIVDAAIRALPIPKRMRWGASRAEFVRPVHWLLMLFGQDVVDCELLGAVAGRQTRGHRFHANRSLSVGEPAEYEKLLKDVGYVIADFDARGALIRDQVQACGHELGGHAVIDEDLLEEVTALVEWPVALAGGFEKRFLKVPAEALISSMKEHQKYFHVENREGHLLPHFITVSNIESLDPAQVIDGNERVIRPRLSDAAFFYETDCKTSLATRREQLKGIVFQEKLGSIYDKTERIRAIALALGEGLGANAEHVARAAELCKSDLVTDMVYEFGELQGIAGYYYAQNDGEPEDVAKAMNEQYMPRFAGDELPSTLVGSLIALADRLDTVVGIFGIGQPPSGSRDPFALRRACLGILRIIIEKQLPLDLRTCIELAIAQHGALPAADGLTETVLAYMVERLRAYYEDRDIAAEVFLAVTAKQLSEPGDIDRRVHAVHQFSQLPQAQALASANKRVSNLLAKQGEGRVSGSVSVSLLAEPAELELATQLEELQQQVQPLFDAGNYGEGLQQLAGLREAVDHFFDKVMVMVEDEVLRDNRLALLARLRAMFLQVADISLLVPGKE